MPESTTLDNGTTIETGKTYTLKSKTDYFKDHNNKNITIKDFDDNDVLYSIDGKDETLPILTLSTEFTVTEVNEPAGRGGQPEAQKKEYQKQEEAKSQIQISEKKKVALKNINNTYAFNVYVLLKWAKTTNQNKPSKTSNLSSVSARRHSIAVHSSPSCSTVSRTRHTPWTALNGSSSTTAPTR